MRFSLHFDRLVVTVAVMLCLCATGLAEVVPWAENGHWYEVVYVPEGISWTEANNAAKSRGGYLVSITSTLENDFIYSLINKDERYWITNPDSSNGEGPWIGAYQTDKLAEPAGHWAWVSGEPWDFANWAPGEPNNSDGNEDYAMFFGLGTRMSKQWNDAEDSPSGEKIKTYIVEYNARPPEATPPETAPATAAVVSHDAPTATEEWDWRLMGSWAIIGILLAALAGMTYLWNRARANRAQ